MALEGEHLPANPDPRAEAARNIGLVVYALQALGFFAGGITFVAGVIVNYVKIEDVRGTYVESHFRWQIRTFWFGLAWGALGVLTWWVLGLGLVILGISAVWVLYRIIKGGLALYERKPVQPAPMLGD